MADDDGVMYSVAADYELDVGNLVVFHGRGPPASSAMTLFFSHLSRLLEKAYLVLLIDLCACVRVFFFAEWCVYACGFSCSSTVLERIQMCFVRIEHQKS
jgi:hypothetical protein